MISAYLHKLNATGEDGFEGLIKVLLQRLTHLEFHLAVSGSQHGRDAATACGTIMFECKRYDKTHLSDTNLLGSIEKAQLNEPLLDVWILVTTADVISDQIITQRRQKASTSAVDFVLLSSSKGSSENLDYLAAAYSDVVLKFFQNIEHTAAEYSDLKTLLGIIQNDPLLGKQIEKLKGQLLEPTVGWPTWRKHSISNWDWIVDASNSSMARYGQELSILNAQYPPIERRKTISSLTQWYQDWIGGKRSGFCVTGQEGDGKTWSVAQWLSKNLLEDRKKYDENNGHHPPIIFACSLNCSGKDGIEAVIVSQLEKDLRSQVDWCRKLRRWQVATAARKSVPLAILVLDGLNERYSHVYWRQLITEIVIGEWADSVALICTSRSIYWDEYFSALNVPFTRAELLGYDDVELGEALRQRGLTLSQLPEDTHVVIRKPRYFDLAMRHMNDLGNSGDFTLARLLFEDWKDRYSRKTTFPLSERQFNSVLMSLCTGSISNSKAWSQNQIEDLIRSDLKVETFQELSTGGVLTETTAGWKVSDKLLPLGLGLLLYYYVIESQKDDKSPNQLIADWIEPFRGLDVESKILEFAALTALRDKSCGNEILCGFVAAWLNCQNPASVKISVVVNRLSVYLNQNCKSYLELAETFWSDAQNNSWAQEILFRAFHNWLHQSIEFRTQLKFAVEKWLGTAFVSGQPALLRRQGDQAEEELCEVHKQLALRFGEDVLSEFSTRTVGGFSLHFTADVGMLRLGRVGLSLISSVDNRTQFITSIVVAYLAESVLDTKFTGALKDDQLDWIVRTASVEFTDKLLRVAVNLSKEEDAICRRAAARMLESIGTEKAWLIRKQLDLDVLFINRPLIRKMRQEPFHPLRYADNRTVDTLCRE